MLHFIDLDSTNIKKESLNIYGHTMNLVSTKTTHQIYFLGGFGYKNKEEINFIIYDILKEGFGEPTVQGEKLSFRSFHTTSKKKKKKKKTFIQTLFFSFF